MVLDIRAVPTDPTPESNVRLLKHRELLTLASLDPAMGLDVDLIGRVRCGLDYCFGAFIDDRLIGYYWIAKDSIEAIHNSDGTERSGVPMSFPSNYVFAYKAFVHEDYRGRGFYSELVHHACRWAYRHLQVDMLISTADWTNYAALRSCRRQGKKSLGLVWRFGIFDCLFTRGPNAARCHGILVGQRARIKTRQVIC